MGQDCMKELRFHYVTPEIIPTIWEGIKNELEKEKETWEQGTTLEGWKATLLNGECQLWTILDRKNHVHATIITEIEVNGVGKSFNILWLRGRWTADLRLGMEEIEAVAASLDCYRVMVTGRKAWGRLLGPLGYEFQSVTVVKEIKRKRAN